MMVVENEKLYDLKKARIIFPLYLLLFAVFVLPIAWAGTALVGSSGGQSQVLSIPLMVGQTSWRCLHLLAVYRRHLAWWWCQPLLLQLCCRMKS